MVRNNQYVPILKGKEGEFRALRDLPGNIKDSIVPLVEIVHCPASKTFEAHVRTLANYICKFWLTGRLIYIDGYMIDQRGRLQNGVHPLEDIHGILNSAGFSMIPVVNSSTSNLYNMSAKRICIADNLGACIRLFCSGHGSYKNSETINHEIENLVRLLEINPSRIDLVLDLRSLEGISVAPAVNYILQILDRLTNLESWRSLVLAGGNFPINLSHLTPNNLHLICRTEWSIWSELVRSRNPRRIPSYSDYGVSHPEIIEYEGTNVNMSASIRYTGLDNFYIFRGRGTRQDGFEQFFDLSGALTVSRIYRGRDFSYGDNFIYECANTRERTGNPSTWRRVGTNHHITTVEDQLRQFFRDLMATRTS